MQKCDGAAAASAVALSDLIEADPGLHRTAEIVVTCEPAGFARGDEYRAQGIAELQVLDRERSAGAVVFARPARVVLGAAEVGEHLRVAPLNARECRPFVVIARMSARVAHGVDRAAAAEHPP